MKTIKYFGFTLAILCFFLVFGSASASTADVLQPAADVIYNENLIVNGTGLFDSIKIGKQGIGGVTFFNGTIVNETTNSNGDGIPVTFGDDVRIDGSIWRGANSGPGDNMPVKVMDDLYVEGALTGGGSVVFDDNVEITKSLRFTKYFKQNNTIMDPDDANVSCTDNNLGEIIFWHDADGNGTPGDRQDYLYICAYDGANPGTLGWWQIW